MLIKKIEALDTKHHVFIGAILRNNPNIKLNENQEGVMVNTSTLSESCLMEIHKYLNYVEDQETILQKIECEKEAFKLQIEKE